jgi:hypothetical protein
MLCVTGTPAAGDGKKITFLFENSKERVMKGNVTLDRATSRLASISGTSCPLQGTNKQHRSDH